MKITKHQIPFLIRWNWLTTVGVALAELLATEGSSSLKLSVVVGTGMTSSLFKQLKSILMGLPSEMLSTGQSFVNTASFF